MTIFLDAVTADHFDTEVLQQHWIPLAKEDTDTAAVLRERLGVDFAAAHDRVWETDDFRYFPVVATYQRGETIERETIVFALGSEFLVTLQPSEHFLPFDEAVAKMRRNPALTGSAHGVMYALLWALNETSERVIHATSGTLAKVHDEIETVTGGRAIDLRGAMSRMDGAEEIVSRVQETQLHLARAARHLAADTPPGHRELNGLISVLLADIDGVKQHAGIQHDKIRYLQQSVLTWSAVRQNRIVTVLTTVTAIFLPPTLIATLYTWMPEAQWQYGFPAATLMTLLAAVLPLTYIRKKGWLR
ncbi:magnesium transporter CorA family protein [Nocardia pneumoniae]|uniref:magnesium transporter CorA family protein n=1 Tax=Nocardia pneumoniae TaxID=228601 RepID=UPI0002EE152D|nr:CorA family divalent cation transporter [Nocardia pneumoniae]